MMPFNPPPEPPDFDKKVRQPGNAWLAKNPTPKKGTRDYWSRFKSDLADGFNNLCGLDAYLQKVNDVSLYDFLTKHISDEEKNNPIVQAVIRRIERNEAYQQSGRDFAGVA